MIKGSLWEAAKLHDTGRKQEGSSMTKHTEYRKHDQGVFVGGG